MGVFTKKNNSFGLDKTDYSNGKFTDYTEVQINKIIQKIKWFLLIENHYLLAIRGDSLHFCGGVALGASPFIPV